MIPKTPDKSGSCAVIAYENLIVTSTQAPEAIIANTYERYAPSTGSVTAKFQLSSASNINFVAIAAHNIGTHDGGTEVLLQYATTVGGALIDIESITPNDNSAILVQFDALTVAEIAITTNAVTAGLEIGVVYAGTTLAMPQPIYGGISPIDLSLKHDYLSNVSETGQFLGRTVTRKGFEGSFSWRYLDPVWYRDYFQPFVLSAVTKPFFIQWRPDLYDATVFGYTTSDITPSNMGGGSQLMSVSINMRAHSDV